MSAAVDTSGKEEKEEVENPDIHFEPVVKLTPVEVKTHEEEEKELFKMRAKLFRFNFTDENPEWKERGVGDVKFMEHRTGRSIRLIMRRDKTHKICANHFITQEMQLKPSAGSDRAWVWTVPADFADEVSKLEQLAIRFKNRENADKFKEEFERCQQILRSRMDTVTTDLKKLTVQEDEAKEEEDGQCEEEKRHENGASGEGNSEPAGSEAHKPQDKDTASSADPE